MCCDAMCQINDQCPCCPAPLLWVHCTGSLACCSKRSVSFWTDLIDGIRGFSKVSRLTHVGNGCQKVCQACLPLLKSVLVTTEDGIRFQDLTHLSWLKVPLPSIQYTSNDLKFYSYMLSSSLHAIWKISSCLCRRYCNREDWLLELLICFSLIFPDCWLLKCTCFFTALVLLFFWVKSILRIYS